MIVVKLHRYVLFMDSVIIGYSLQSQVLFPPGIKCNISYILDVFSHCPVEISVY